NNRHQSTTSTSIMNKQQQLVEIGRGNCGSVWADPLSDVVVVDNDNDTIDIQTVIKREDCNRNRSVTKEHHIHKHILASLASATTTSPPTSNLLTGYQVNIPAALSLIPSTSPEWASSLLPCLPPGFEPCLALRNERIPPMGQTVRNLLATKFHASLSPFQTSTPLLKAITNEENCLVRPFLGRRRLPPRQSGQPGQRRIFGGFFFSFRNYPLHLDQIEELGLPKEGYAVAMADTLAFLHWEAGVDGRDVEFVIAGPRSETQGSQGQGRAARGEAGEEGEMPRIGSRGFDTTFKEEGGNGGFGEHAMWLLDFDLCREMKMPGAVDEDGEMATEVGLLEAAAAGFWGNDPWYPRPPSNSSNGDGIGKNGNGNADDHGAGSDHHLADKQLWELFKGRYLETSQQILEEKGEEGRARRELPGKVMDMILRTRWRNGKLVYLESK
ncbi:hypothetical protein B0T20DRAFT_360889, partial [Sordaria brevicollis]